MFKFLFGPITAYSSGLNLLEAIIFTIVGMMTTVYIITTTGKPFKNWLLSKFSKNRRVFSKKSRRFVRIWAKYGIKGTAFLTPMILTPIVGSIIAVSFNERKQTIIQYMFWSALFWSIVMNCILYYFGNSILKYFQPEILST